ncbi:Short-chain dehydrogenase/reductase 2b, partial [Irineochytrium annulatum]
MFEFIFGSGKAFHPDQLPDLSGKVVIVTGASAGLGKESTIVLAGKGAQVIMACRSLSKAEGAVADIKKVVPNAKLEVMEMDLSSLASVKAFADKFK